MPYIYYTARKCANEELWYVVYHEGGCEMILTDLPMYYPDEQSTREYADLKNKWHKVKFD